jgi:hypothetical protein
MDRGGNRQPILGSALVTLAVVLAAVLALAGCGGGDDAANLAHINPDSSAGSTHDLKPDERKGIPPPPAHQTNLQKAAEEAGCYLELHLKDEGHGQVPQNSPEPEYKTDPPSSGKHSEPPNQQADGAYLEEPEPINYVGSLDYGRMEIQYAGDLSEEIQRELKGLYDTMYGATLLFPNNEMNFGIAATTWTNVLDCTGWEGQKTLDAIRAFGKATWGKYGAQPVKSLEFTGPTPAKPAEPKPAK